MATNDIRLWLYPGANPGSTADLWEPYFADISAYIRRPGNDGGRPIQYSWGKQDESTQTDSGQMTLTLDDRDGRFSTDNANGPWYGLLDINTPIRLVVGVASDSFTRTTSAGLGTINSALNQTWSTDGLNTWTCNGSRAQAIVANANTYVITWATNAAAKDTDVRSTVTPLAAAVGASYGGGHALRSAADPVNFIYSTVEFDTAGTVSVKIRQVVNGATNTLAQANPIPSSSYTTGTAWNLRTQADANVIRVKAWPASSTEPTTWTIQGTSLQFTTGAQVGLLAARFFGNTNSGTAALVAFDDFSMLSLEWTGFVVSWPDSYDITGNNSWAPITCSGALRRLRQGANPVQSPLRHQLAATANCVSYWPMEEGADADYFANTVVGGKISRFGGVTPGQDTSLAGGGAAPVLAADTGVIRLPVTGGVNSGGTGFSAMVLFKLPSLPASKTKLITVSPRSGPVATYTLSVDATGLFLEAFNTSGTLITSAVNAYATDFTQWTAWQIETDNTLSPGNTSISAIYHQVGQALYYAQSITVAGTTLSNIGGMTLNGPSGTAYAHAWLGQNTLPFVTNSFSLVSAGYAGETAIARWTRVTGEAGIPSSFVGSSSTGSVVMGVQSEGNTMAILQSIADTDYGVIIERSAGLEFVPRETRYNAPSLYTLSKAAGEIGAIPAPVRDDQRLRNTWTISRSGGSTVTYADAASVARNGTWSDSATVNEIDDGNLLNQATWRTAIGISPRRRWPSITLNFGRSPQLRYVWGQRYYGWRFGITTGLVHAAGNEPDLIMEGFQATLDPDLWTVDMNCTSAYPWQIGTLNNNRYYGARYTTLGAGLTTTGTTVTFSVSDAGETWRPGASAATITVGGEDIKLGTISARSGSGPYTYTVTGCTRSVNGIVKTHSTGDVVAVKNVLRVGL